MPNIATKTLMRAPQRLICVKTEKGLSMVASIEKLVHRGNDHGEKSALTAKREFWRLWQKVAEGKFLKKFSD